FMYGKPSAHQMSPKMGTHRSWLLRKKVRNGVRGWNTAWSTRMSVQVWWLGRMRYRFERDSSISGGRSTSMFSPPSRLKSQVLLFVHWNEIHTIARSHAARNDFTGTSPFRRSTGRKH